MKVYLDQFAISCMADAMYRDRNEKWCEIYTLLLQLKDNGKIQCLTSIESAMETSRRDDRGIKDNYLIIKDLTSDIYLKHINEIISMQISSQIKHVDYVFEDYMCPVYHDFQKTETSSGIRDVVENTKQMLNSNQLNIAQDFSSNESNLFAIKKPLIDYFYILFKNDFIASICGQSNSTFNREILSLLNSSYHFSYEDFHNLCAEVNRSGFDNIPTLYILWHLSSINIVSPSKDFNNDMIDIHRISVSLPLFNFVFCDSKWKEIIIADGIDTKFDAKIFSAKSPDLSAFIEELEALL